MVAIISYFIYMYLAGLLFVLCSAEHREHKYLYDVHKYKNKGVYCRVTQRHRDACRMSAQQSHTRIHTGINENSAKYTGQDSSVLHTCPVSAVGRRADGL